MKETDLFKPVKYCLMRDLGCSDVYGELANCDVVGKRGNYDVIVELKTSLNFKVILQAIERSNKGAYTYIAVPKPSKNNIHWEIYHRFIQPHGIGLIYVSPYIPGVNVERTKQIYNKRNEDDIPYCEYVATIAHKASFNRAYTRLRRKGSKRITAGLQEWEKNNIGGSKGGETVTAYSNMIDAVKKYLLSNGWSSIEDILDNVPEVSNHYKSPKASLVATLRERWNSHWCIVKRDPQVRRMLYNINEREEE